MKAIDSLEEIEAKSYAPLYEAKSYNNSMMAMQSSILQPLQLPSFAAKIMENEQKIMNDINNMSKSEKKLLKKQHSNSFISPFISSVKIIIKEGRVDINENYDKNIDEIDIIDPTISSIPAQTFRLDFKSLQVTHIIKHENDLLSSKVAYVILRTNDICLLEFDEVLQAFGDNIDHKYLSLHNDDNSFKTMIKGKANPLLFKTLETQTFGKNVLFDNKNQNKEDESDVLHLFLSLRVKQVESNENTESDDYNDNSSSDDDDVNKNNNDPDEVQSVYDTNCDDTFLQIFTLVNLRALTHEFRLESEWHTKLAEFFSVDTISNNKEWKKK